MMAAEAAGREASPPPGRDALVYATALVLPRAVSFVLLPVFAARFTLAEMGLLATCWVFMDFFQTLAGLGMRQALGRFFPLAEGARRRREVLTTALAGTLGGGLGAALLSAAAWAVPATRGRLEFLARVDLRLLAWLLTAAALGNLVSTLLVYFRAERRPYAFLAAGGAGALVELSLAAWLIAAARLGVAELMAVEAAKQAVMLLFIAWQGRRDLVPAVSASALAALAGFGAWLVPVALCEWATLSADRFWLGQLAGMDAVGVYGFFGKFAAPLGILFTGGLMELHSRLYAMSGEVGMTFARDRIARYLRRGGFLALAVAAGIPAAFLLLEAVRPVFPPAYRAGLPFFPLLAGAGYVVYWGKYYGAVLEYRFRPRAVLAGMGCGAAAA
ncbi:MAG TPA: hypothetical protein VK465_17225, partial [Fibrobacteria bacterium]|nr:hypothetical protein [Fibrobacteria bacterium]